MISRAVVLGAALGFSMALACGPTQVARCLPSNCSGCCDSDGVCRDGTTLDACGTLGVTCSVCDLGQVCEDFSCRGASIVAEDGGATQGTDGGAQMDAGTDGGATACGPSSCASGCCRNGQCMPGNDFGACGAGGGACTSCIGSQTCTGGACTTACNGCRDAVGNCLTGADVAACGSGGNACIACFDGQVCEGGQCKDTTCSASNCQSGCCDGTTCQPGTADARCGTGGQTCMTCQNGATCVNGTCQGGGTGNDGGFPLPDGGFSFCPGCSTGCCDAFSLTCEPGTSVLACGSGGNLCNPCILLGFFSCVNGTCQ